MRSGDKSGVWLHSNISLLLHPMKRLLLTLVYALFTLVSGAHPVLDAGVNTSHACCCSSMQGCCSTDEPMDCCADNSQELPTSYQLAGAVQGLKFVAVAHARVRALFVLAFAYQSSSPIANAHPPDKRVNPYLAYHQLIYYA